ncbi:FAD-binding oxidoreductase [Altericista sp. CCNU0014]|uniref:FAD-binding oxidoreductase n=1 Tax=Altericista sp. CCNU0014 TaxID=3082949 RepID=UPI0038517006
MSSADAIAQKLATVLPPERIVSCDRQSESWQGYSKAACMDDANPLLVVSPETVAELTEVVALAYRGRWRLLIAGQGTKLGWGMPAKRIDLAICTRRLSLLVDHAVGDMTVTAQAGMTFGQLQAILAKHDQWLPLDPVYPDRATLGGILATRDAGSLRHRYGGVRDLCLGLTFARADGQVAKAGGRVVKNVAGYDLMKLFAGSFGTLGIVTELTLRTYPLPERSGTVLVRGEMEAGSGCAAIANLARDLMQSTLTPTAFDIWTGLVPAAGDVILALRFQSLAESVSAQTERVCETARSLGFKAEAIADPRDADWWSTAAASLRESLEPETVLCQVGVLPASAVSSLAEIQEKAARQSVALQGRIHARSGVGQLRLTGAEERCRALLGDIRSFLEQADGYLTILEAPLTLKQTMEVWGYSGNALATMRKLKERFDPQGGLNPGRFVGGL